MIKISRQFKISCIFWFFILLFSTAIFSQQNDKDDLENDNVTTKLEDIEKIERTNWFVYLYQKIGANSYSRVIPMYSYNRNSEQAYDEYFLWPLLIGYESKQNLYPEELPFAKQFRWYSFPTMTLSGNAITPRDYAETNTLVSLSLLTFYEHRYVAEKYFSTSWFSLPGLSYYNRQVLFEKDLEIDHLSFGSPLFVYQDTFLNDHKKIYMANYWALDPTFVALGKDSFKLLKYSNWGKDTSFSFMSLFNFSVFEIFTSFYGYPGAKYEHFSEYQGNLEQGVKELYKSKNSPTTRVGFLAPFIQVETSPDGHFSWQLLPLFHYAAKEKQYQFSILPFGLNFTNDGFILAFKEKMFPFVYHDEVYGRWDILWPFFEYINNPAYPKSSLRMRFIFEYAWQQDTEGNTRLNFNIAEQFLVDYSQDNKQEILEVLPFGILFSFLRNDYGYQWRVLGFGYSENQHKRYLQVLFFNVPIATKQ